MAPEQTTEQQADATTAEATADNAVEVTQEQTTEATADTQTGSAADALPAAEPAASEQPAVQVVDLPDAPIALLFDCGGGNLINLTQITHVTIADPQHNDLVYVVGAPRGIPLAKDRTRILRQICPTVEGRV